MVVYGILLILIILTSIVLYIIRPLARRFSPLASHLSPAGLGILKYILFGLPTSVDYSARQYRITNRTWEGIVKSEGLRVITHIDG